MIISCMEMQIKNKANDFFADENGCYGPYGGAYIPEMLYKNVEGLRQSYLQIIGEDKFREELVKNEWAVYQLKLAAGIHAMDPSGI